MSMVMELESGSSVMRPLTPMWASVGAAEEAGGCGVFGPLDVVGGSGDVEPVCRLQAAQSDSTQARIARRFIVSLLAAGLRPSSRLGSLNFQLSSQTPPM